MKEIMGFNVKAKDNERNL